MLSVILLLVLQQPGPNAAPPRSDVPVPAQEQGEFSSSKETIRNSRTRAGEVAAADVTEMSPYDPHRAAKAVEVGDFYFKRKNYRAAASRYDEAIQLKPDHAVAAFKLALTFERLEQPEKAHQYYERALLTDTESLVTGEARAALQRLDPKIDLSKYNPSEARARLRLEEAERAFEFSNYALIADRAREVIKLSPKTARARYLLAYALERTGEFDQAYAGYREFLLLQPAGDDALKARESMRKLEPQLKAATKNPTSAPE